MPRTSPPQGGGHSPVASTSTTTDNTSTAAAAVATGPSDFCDAHGHRYVCTDIGNGRIRYLKYKYNVQTKEFMDAGAVADIKLSTKDFNKLRKKIMATQGAKDRTALWG